MPDSDEVRRLFRHAGRFPEVVLSRREIIKYIIVEPSRRAEQVQALLKLDRLQEFRAALRTAVNRLEGKEREAERTEKVAREQLKRALGIEDLGPEPLLRRVNTLRGEAGARGIAAIEVPEDLDSGLADEAPGSQGPIKKVFLADVRALQDALAKDRAVLDGHFSQLASGLAEVRGDPELRAAVEDRSLLAIGLQRLLADACPLCGHPWKEEDLRRHLALRLEKAKRGEDVETSILSSAQKLAMSEKRLRAMISSAQVRADQASARAEASVLADWAAQVERLEGSLVSPMDGLDSLDVLEHQQAFILGAKRQDAIDSLNRLAEGMPDASPSAAARDSLMQGRVRLADARKAEQLHERAQRLSARAQAVLKEFDEGVNGELESLFELVQGNLARYYRHINADDEGDFEAQLTYRSGAADLKVGFYGRGSFPPAAYHSEGHQDGMGLCLYLALMQQLLKNAFQLAVLDDVVMSVDVQHRRSVCSLITGEFPGTQFIITTHDRLWMQQMRAAGVARGHQLLAIGKWSVETGPLVAVTVDTWERIDSLLEEGDVPGAGAALRYYLEYSARELGAQLGAKVTLRPDGDYELNDLLPAILTRWKDLLGRSLKSAQSWGRAEKVAEIEERLAAFEEYNKNFNEEGWAVNKAVHFNAWATFSPEEFRSVVEAYRGLLGCFECCKCKCWPFCERKGAETVSVGCHCGEISLSLVRKK